eukprot:NODE_458_length_7216_cov_0.728537.p6 type:complete len:125 gc:universal NODE_458_length_7216_cov_0.728537:707-333(-)
MYLQSSIVTAQMVIVYGNASNNQRHDLYFLYFAHHVLSYIQMRYSVSINDRSVQLNHNNKYYRVGYHRFEHILMHQWLQYYHCKMLYSFLIYWELLVFLLMHNTMSQFQLWLNHLLLISLICRI